MSDHEEAEFPPSGNVHGTEEERPRTQRQKRIGDLTAAQRRVVSTLIETEGSTEETARLLGIAIKTLRRHEEDIRQIYGVRNRLAITIEAKKRGAI